MGDPPRATLQSWNSVSTHSSLPSVPLGRLGLRMIIRARSMSIDVLKMPKEASISSDIVSQP